MHLGTLIASGHFWIESISSLSGTSQLITQTTALMLGIYGSVAVLCCCLYVLMTYSANVLTTIQQVNFLFMAGVAAGTVAAAVLLSLKVPVLTVRSLIVLLPPIAGVLYLLFRATPRIQPFLLCSVCAAAFLTSAVEAQNSRKLPSWREPAAVIADFPSCTNQPILISRMGIRSPAMYLYYTGEVKPRFIDIDPELLVKGGGGNLAGQISDAFASPCPIKFWGAHLKRDQIEALRAAFQMLGPDLYFIQWEHGAGHLLVIDKSKSVPGH
jgi:hypothetical protein